MHVGSPYQMYLGLGSLIGDEEGLIDLSREEDPASDEVRIRCYLLKFRTNTAAFPDFKRLDLQCMHLNKFLYCPI